jgi:hypothetical protein
MLDSDLAEMYQVETKNLKRAVRANIKRFPDDFMFELTKEEYDSLRCKKITLNDENDALRCKYFTSNKRGGNHSLKLAIPPFRNAGKGKKRNKSPCASCEARAYLMKYTKVTVPFVY